MKYFLDTEFIESGPNQPIHLISIGIVAEDERELYHQHNNFPADLANDWVKKHVYPQLGLEWNGHAWIPTKHNFETWANMERIKEEIMAFVGDDPNPQFYGYYADYDWVVFCQIFGTMMDLPRGRELNVIRKIRDVQPYHPNDYSLGAKDTVIEKQVVGKFPMFCMDIKQLAVILGNPKLPDQDSQEHNALNDARWNKKAYEFLVKHYENGEGGGIQL